MHFTVGFKVFLSRLADEQRIHDLAFQNGMYPGEQGADLLLTVVIFPGGIDLSAQLANGLDGGIPFFRLEDIGVNF